jgi:cell division protein ZapA
MTEKKKINVVIDGRNFTVVGDEDEEYILALARYVDKNIKRLANKNSFLSQTMAATLAALNITDELFKTKEELSDLKKETKEPLENYEDAKINLKKANEEIELLKRELTKSKDEILNLNQEKSKTEKEIKDYINLNKEMEEKIKKSEASIKLLQDKNFKNQIEIVEIKKELKEYIKLLELETSDDN